MVAGEVLQGTVTHCGLFVWDKNKCFGTKSDGVMLDPPNGTRATLRILKSGCQKDVNACSDLLCSGFELAVMIVGESLVKIPPDPKFEKDMASTINFFVVSVLPKIKKGRYDRQHKTRHFMKMIYNYVFCF
jgi:hypothetical protein